MRSEGMRIVKALPSLPKRPQVILSANDDMALGRLKPCKGRA
jgi:inositol transport system substrate-binding protein